MRVWRRRWPRSPRRWCSGAACGEGAWSSARAISSTRSPSGAFKQWLRSALSTGQLLGREADYKLWYLFPRREATHLGNKVVAVFECHVRVSGLSGVAADRFREEAKLRGAVLALRRANGGRLGIYLPRYFQTAKGRVPVAEACRTLDEESRRFGSRRSGPGLTGAGDGEAKAVRCRALVFLDACRDNPLRGVRSRIWHATG